MFQQNENYIINYGYINYQTKIRADLFCKQTRLNLVIFNKNEGNFSKKKDISKNVKSQFVNGGLHLVRFIS